MGWGGGDFQISISVPLNFAKFLLQQCVKVIFLKYASAFLQVKFIPTVVFYIQFIRYLKFNNMTYKRILPMYEISQEPGFILENQGSVRKQKGHILRL